MTREEAVRKAAALLRLAARGGTVGEAAAAAGKAQEIMDRYELTREVMGDGAAAPEPDEPIVDFGGRAGGSLDETAKTEIWLGILSRNIALNHGCYVFVDRRNEAFTIQIVGRPTMVETVRYLYGWLKGEIARLAREKGAGMGSGWRRSFRVGAAQEIGIVLKRQRGRTVAEVQAENAGNPHALMLVNRGLARLDPAGAEAHARAVYEIGKGPKGRSTDPDAHEQGRQAARSLKINAARGALGGGQKLLDRS